MVAPRALAFATVALLLLGGGEAARDDMKKKRHVSADPDIAGRNQGSITDTGHLMLSLEKDTRAMVDWIKEHGGSFKGAELTRDVEHNRIVVRATREIEDDSLVVEIPHELAMSPWTAMDTALGKIKAFQDIPPFHQLVLHLITEATKGEESDWWPFIRCMPISMPTSLNFNKAEAAELQGSQIGPLTVEARKGVMISLARINSTIVSHHPDVFPTFQGAAGGQHLQVAWIWAANLVGAWSFPCAQNATVG